MARTAVAAAALLLHVATGWATAGHKIIAHIAGQEVTWSATTTMGFLPSSIKIEAQDGFTTALGGRTLSSVVTDPITYGHTDAGQWSLGMRHWFVQDPNATSLSMKECNTKWCLPLSTLNYTQRLHDQLVLAESGTPQPPSRANKPSALSFMSFLVGEIHDPSHVRRGGVITEAAALLEKRHLGTLMDPARMVCPERVLSRGALRSGVCVALMVGYDANRVPGSSPYLECGLSCRHIVVGW
jgi:hypothetical protein